MRAWGLRKLKVGLVVTNQQWRGAASPFRAVHEGLRRLGCRVCCAAPMPVRGPIFDTGVDICFVWNGRKPPYQQVAEGMRKQGKCVVVMERGFFQRCDYTQLDTAGFGHRASWADQLRRPAGEDGAARFAAAWGQPPTPTRARKRGCVLILLQSPGDAQLADSEIDVPAPLVEAVEAATPRGAAIRYRPHPRCPWDRGKGRAKPAAGRLKQAVAASRFVVTINSNAGNEALAWGRPVLCLGPALYEEAGAAKRTGLAEMPPAIRQMLGGWAPKPAVVRNYLYWLACRQWSRAELAAGQGLKSILEQCHEL